MASAATHNRLELSRLGKAAGDRYRRIEADFMALEDLLVDPNMKANSEPPTQIAPNLDASDVALHGTQKNQSG